MGRAVAVAAVLAVVAVGGTSCGDDPEATTATIVRPQPEVTTFAEVLDEVPNPVRIDAFAMDPQTIEVRVGETVTWINEDTVEHWLVSRTADVFDSATLRPGDSFAHTFDEPGTYRYACVLHPVMSGTVVVR